MWRAKSPMRSNVIAKRMVETTDAQIGGHRVLAGEQFHALVDDARRKRVGFRVVVDHRLRGVEVGVEQCLPRAVDGVAHIACHVVKVVGATALRPSLKITRI